MAKRGRGTKRGGGVLNFFKGLFTRKAPAATANTTFNVRNPMLRPGPSNALKNMRQRRRMGQTHLVNLQRNIRNEQETEAELAALSGEAAVPLGTRNVNLPNNLQWRRNKRNTVRNASRAGMNARLANNFGQAYANSQATSRKLARPLGPKPSNAELEEYYKKLLANPTSP